MRIIGALLAAGMSCVLAISSAHGAGERTVNLARYAKDIRESLQAACKVTGDKVSNQQFKCLRNHLLALRKIGYRPNIFTLTPDQRAEVEKACAGPRKKGPVKWFRCVESEFNRLKVPANYPDLGALNASLRRKIEGECRPLAKKSAGREAFCQTQAFAKMRNAAGLDKNGRDKVEKAAERNPQPQRQAKVTPKAASGRLRNSSAPPASTLNREVVNFKKLNPDSDFWPAWQGERPKRLRRRNGKKLAGHELYSLAAPSVFMVLAAASSEHLRSNLAVKQGSAVALSKSMLATNCHILKDMPVIVLLQGDRYGAAQLVYADPNTDRCYLRSEELELTPVPGVRDFGTLKMAEPVYAIAAPRGLQQSIQNGIISQKRANNGVNLIQTTAAAAPGSSGGALFDTYGNLVGVTDFNVAQEHWLHFAIAADEYWK